MKSEFISAAAFSAEMVFFESKAALSISTTLAAKGGAPGSSSWRCTADIVGYEIRMTLRLTVCYFLDPNAAVIEDLSFQIS